MIKFSSLAILAAISAGAQDGSISATRIREHTRFLASDVFEGRGVGQRGGDLVTEYLANQLALTGARPAGDSGTFFQKVPLVGIDPQPESKLTASAGGK